MDINAIDKNNELNADEKTINSGKTQKFIKRLYKVTCDENIPEITWNNNGTSVLIPNKELFRQNAMSLISHTREYTAFLRSLNHYQFIRLKRVEEEADEYIHPHFKRNSEDLLPLIVRQKIIKKGNKKIKRVTTPNTEVDTMILDQQMQFIQENLTTANQNFYAISEEVVSLRHKVDQQEKTINGLIEVLSKVFRQGISNDSSKPALENNMNDFNGLIMNIKKEDNENKVTKIIDISDNKNISGVLNKNSLRSLNGKSLKPSQLDFIAELPEKNEKKIKKVNSNRFPSYRNDKYGGEDHLYLDTSNDKKIKYSDEYLSRTFSPTDIAKMNISSQGLKEVFPKRKIEETVRKNACELSEKSSHKENDKNDEKVRELKSPEYHDMPSFESSDENSNEKEEHYSNLFF